MDQQVESKLSGVAFIALLSRYCRVTACHLRETDRRLACRFLVEEGAATATIQAGSVTARGTLANVSSGGAQIMVDKPMPHDAQIELRFHIGGQTYRNTGRVIRSLPCQVGYLITACFEPGPFELIS
ncbi:MAG: PilZ domain-containing protein [Phycisphaerae bacterium]|nr:PilZ domain-containing protein [Phycisphaerae bacterium]